MNINIDDGSLGECEMYIRQERQIIGGGSRDFLAGWGSWTGKKTFLFQYLKLINLTLFKKRITIYKRYERHKFFTRRAISKGESRVVMTL